MQNLLDISIDVQFIVITLISAYLAFYKIKKKKLPSLYAMIGIAIILVSFLPTPTSKQYFAMSIPFLIIASAPILYYLYKKGNWKKIETHEATSKWRIRTVKKVSKRLDELIQDKETIITWWPGYLLESKKAIILPGTENHFGIMVGDNLTKEQRTKYKIISYEELKKEIASKKVKTILLGNWVTGNLDPKMDIVEKGYHVITTVDFAIFGSKFPVTQFPNRIVFAIFLGLNEN